MWSYRNILKIITTLGFPNYILFVSYIKNKFKNKSIHFETLFSTEINQLPFPIEQEQEMQQCT